jgi:predicted LPLAT superfamily acyltransferase
MQQLAQAFATQLEDIVRRYPTQWFNYFDFWKA